MTLFLVHLLLGAALILYLANQHKGFEVDSILTTILTALGLGLLNALLLPVALFLFTPLGNLVAIALLFIILACMLKLTSRAVKGFRVAGFVPAIYGSILLTLLDILISTIN